MEKIKCFIARKILPRDILKQIKFCIAVWKYLYIYIHIKRLSANNVFWERVPGRRLPRASQQMRAEPALLWVLPLAKSTTIPLFIMSKSLFHMDNHIEWVSLSYMWKVFQEVIYYCGTTAKKKFLTFPFIVVDFDISNN